MTKSTITREESVQAVFDLKVGYRLGFADIEILKRVARMALAAMDSEPVAYMVRRHDEHEGTGTLIHAEYLQRYQDRGDYHYTPLYRHAQPAPVVPGKWIPVSEQNPDCWCLTCRPVVLSDMRFVVCPDCGNKRCPRANDHRNACTGSNEPGQEGSAYPDTPQEEKP